MPTRPYFTRQKDDALETTTDVQPFANAAPEARDGRIRGYVRDVQGENNRFFQEARERRNPEIAKLRGEAEKSKGAPAAAKLFSDQADDLAAKEMVGYTEPDSLTDKKARVRKNKLVEARRKRGLSDDGKTLANGNAIPAPVAAPAAPAAPVPPKPRRVGQMTREEIEEEKARLAGF